MPQTVEIREILKDFYKISGIRISIHDTEFNEIYSYPATSLPYCKCLQENSAVLSDCEKNDSAAFEKVKATGEICVYKCRRGLYEAVAPIYHYGTLSGYLMMGQIRDKSESSLEYITSKANDILNDKQKAEELALTVNAIDKGKIDSYINVMVLLAEYLTGTNRLFTHNEKLPQLIKEYINKNYQDKISLSILSQKFGCCNATLTKSFKKEFNISIMEYLCGVRLKAAEGLIVKTRKSFKEISSICGFYDQNYFSKTFTRYYGSPPSEYRREHTKEVIS